MDLSAVISLAILEPGLILGISDQERTEVAALLSDVVLTVQSFTTFEPVPDLILPSAPTATEDRTAEYIDFIATAVPSNS